MQQILKRLELIKTSISIEDEEIIEMQVTKLSTMSTDDEVKEILRQLSHNDYGEAIVKIENYLVRYRGVVLYEDKEISGLKMELKILEAKLGELSEEKNEYLNEISEFNTQYSLHLGEIIRAILELKKDIFYRKSIFESNPLEDIEDSKEYQQYQEAKNNYNEFYHEYEEIINQERFELNEEEKAELKKLYRKASRVCHPDIVQDELKTQAIKLMQELN
jgi:small-conductance mechanosensitive channel